VMGVVYYIVGFLGAQVMVEFLEETLFAGLINPAAEIFFTGVFGDGLITAFLSGITV